MILNASGLEAEDSFRSVEVSLIGVAKSEIDRYIHSREVRLIGRRLSIGPGYGHWKVTSGAGIIEHHVAIGERGHSYRCSPAGFSY